MTKAPTCSRPSASVLSVALLSCSASCAADFYSAQVAGFAKRASDEDAEPRQDAPGINGVEVRMFLDEPTGFGDDGFVAQTITAPNRASAEPLDGYFSHRIAWQTDSARFGESGDSRTIWLATRHPDYEEAVTATAGILSDSVNIVPDLRLTPRVSQVGSVSGRVLVDGVGVDGVRVVLAFEAETGTVERVTRTAGQSGVYELHEVTWSADEPITAQVFVDDAEYTRASVEVELVPGQDDIVAPPLEVQTAAVGIPSLSGEVVNVIGQGLAGVRVRGSARTVSGERSWHTTSDPDGLFALEGLAFLPEEGDLEPVVQVSIDDDRYHQVSNGGDPIAVPVASDRAAALDHALVAERQPRTEFSATISGRCVERTELSSGDTRETPLAGVVVRLQVEDDTGSRILLTQSDSEGRYELLISWQDEEPRLDVPQGEDEQDISLTFAALTRGDETLTFDPLETSVRSWIAVNVLPDAVALPE